MASKELVLQIMDNSRKTVRLYDWQVRFAGLSLARLQTKFCWGSHDCCLWAADAVLAITGKDFASELRGTYDSAPSAASVLQRLGGVHSIASSALGPPVTPMYATTGDILLVDIHKRDTLAVCNNGSILCAGADGLVSIDIQHAKFAWKV